jgi:hypothetical protein
MRPYTDGIPKMHNGSSYLVLLIRAQVGKHFFPQAEDRVVIQAESYFSNLFTYQ